MARRIASIILVGTFILQACFLPLRITGLEPTTETPPTVTPPIPTILKPENTQAVVSPEAPQLTIPTQAITPAQIAPEDQQPTATKLPTPSRTPKPTRAGTKAKATSTQAPSVTNRTAALTPVYVLQPGSPSWLINFTHPEAGCDWLGIGGQVFNTQNEPVTSLVILVEGTLQDEDIRFLSLTGVAPIYGPGGYEIVLGNHPVRSKGKLRIQIFDLAGKPLSEPIAFDTFTECDKNLIIINFVDELPAPGVLRYYFPVFFSSLVVE